MPSENEEGCPSQFVTPKVSPPSGEGFKDGLGFDKKGSGEIMGNGLEAELTAHGEEWLRIHPPRCEWVLIHSLPQPIEVVLFRGKAEIRLDGNEYQMMPGVRIHCQGIVEVHNTQTGPRPRPGNGDTEVWYRHLD